MSICNDISWHVELSIRQGALAEFSALSAEMVDGTRSGAGVLIYERFISADGQTVHVLERYVDSAAAVAHLRVFIDRFGARFSRLVARNRFEVFGEPSAELKEILDRFGATYSARLTGFAVTAS